jgi:hypothetical protein
MNRMSEITSLTVRQSTGRSNAALLSEDRLLIRCTSTAMLSITDHTGIAHEILRGDGGG